MITCKQVDQNNYPVMLTYLDYRLVNSDLSWYSLQPVATEGAPLDVTRESNPSNQELEPVPLVESGTRPVGGISVEESRDLMREADLIDRKVERERIKSKHKEQRRKLKKRRREEQVTTLLYIVIPLCVCFCFASYAYALGLASKT